MTGVLRAWYHPILLQQTIKVCGFEFCKGPWKYKDLEMVKVINKFSKKNQSSVHIRLHYLLRSPTRPCYIL